MSDRGGAEITGPASNPFSRGEAATARTGVVHRGSCSQVRLLLVMEVINGMG
jgi:hypothetical protein